jgi:hypothetical protein
MLTVCGFSAQAQDSSNDDKDKQYVTDQLRLSLYEAASAQSNVLKLLRSGDLLIIDEIRGPYALVTTADGTRGWVKRGFLVTNPTASILLQEEREKNASLFEEIEKLSNSKTVIDTYEKDMDAMNARMATLEAEEVQAEARVSEMQQALADKQEKLDRKLQNNLPPYIVLWDTLRGYWQFIVPMLLVVMLITFLVTKLVIEAHIKSKFHGIKIW